ncbi:alpha/beta hydrolase [Pseudomonas sp. WJP1]|uniref:alpha/beta hydrolase n=1 Tax=Pseudomonas sp. WJP1 TaxID=2986947 RepID=UPI002349AC62|nr:alpha/beta hydrolase [Pseudomonas sp. WJP1]WCM48953.1 alpha/beta hydrolase [Pseudomonas sp. WJP1]
MLIRIVLFAIAALAISSCTTPISIAEVAHSSKLVSAISGEGAFPIQILQPKAGHFAKLRVYIEGDGRAWITASQPSSDPTPLSPMLINMAATDSRPAAYLARPCQFVNSINCNAMVWTDERFSREVIDSMSSALDTLKQRFAVEQFELVGYSGGAAVALILAGERNDVFQVQTIAGNLDPVAWVQAKGLSPLTGSLDPLNYRARLRSIAQRHFVGSADEVITPSLVRGYASKVQAECIEIVEVPATHQEGYGLIWTSTSNKAISGGQCSSVSSLVEPRHL